MNLVQIQEHLKQIPVPTLMQYANGGNPTVPPYLALSEMKRRESMMQSAQNQQSVQQGQMPSVKEQVEQTAGLASLQKQMQSQGLQSLMASARPTAIPENVPQPQRQPESEGLAGLPADNMEFADGGIVAFANGGTADWMSEALEEREPAPPIKKPTPEEAEAILDELRRRGQNIGLITVKDVQAGRIKPFASPKPAVGPAKQGLPQGEFRGTPDEVVRDIASIPDPAERQAASEAYKRQLATIGPLPKLAEPPKPAPQAEPTSPGITQFALPEIEGAKQAREILTGTMQAPTLEDAAKTERGLAALYGMDKPYGEEQMSRIKEMQAERGKALEDRATERLMRGLAGYAAQGRGGLGRGYLSAIEGERIADQQFREKMNELFGGVEAERRKEEAKRMGVAEGQHKRAKEAQLGAAEFTLKQQEQREREVATDRRSQERMTDKEELFIKNYMQANPQATYMDAYSALQAAKAGPRTEETEESRRRRLFEKFMDMQKDPFGQSVLKDKNITNFEQFLALYTMPSASASNPVRAQADAIIRGGK